MTSLLRQIEGKNVIAISFNRKVDPELLRKALNQIKEEWSDKEILLVHGTMDRETRNLKGVPTQKLDIIDEIFPPETQQSFYGKLGTKRKTMARFVYLNNALVYFIGSIPRKSGIKEELETYRTYLGKNFRKQVRFVKK